MSSRWCPKCGAEYREGFSECADCNVALVDEAPAPKPHRHGHEHHVVHGPFSPDDDTVELLWTNSVEAQVIVARLQSECIPAVAFGDDPYGNGPIPTLSSGVRVMVRRSDVGVATALIGEADSPRPDTSHR